MRWSILTVKIEKQLIEDPTALLVTRLTEFGVKQVIYTENINYRLTSKPKGNFERSIFNLTKATRPPITSVSIVPGQFMSNAISKDIHMSCDPYKSHLCTICLKMPSYCSSLVGSMLAK